MILIKKKTELSNYERFIIQHSELIIQHHRPHPHTKNFGNAFAQVGTSCLPSFNST